MSTLVNELSYYGVKGCFFMGKILGIASYNTVAYMGGFQAMLYFPPTKEDILIDEIKKLKQELVEIKTNIKDNLSINQYQYQVVYINNNFSLQLTDKNDYDIICIEEVIDTENNLIPYKKNINNITYPLIEEIT